MTPADEAALREVTREVLAELLPQLLAEALASSNGNGQHAAAAEPTGDVVEVPQVPAPPIAKVHRPSGWREPEPTPTEGVPASSQESTHRIESGAVTERAVRRAAGEGARLVLGPRAVLTPLARDCARRLGVEIEKEKPW